MLRRHADHDITVCIAISIGTRPGDDTRHCWLPTTCILVSTAGGSYTSMSCRCGLGRVDSHNYQGLTIDEMPFCRQEWWARCVCRRLEYTEWHLDQHEGLKHGQTE